MKKIIISLFCLCVGFAASAQDQSGTRVENSPLLTKNGYRYLPVKGDYAIGIEVDPFFKYIGNMFNNTSNNASPFASGYKGGIYGKYFLENNRAIRAKLNLNIYSEGIDGVVPNDGRLPNDPFATGVDEKKMSRTEVELLAGYEFRRGHGRVQGFYGGEVGIGIGAGKDKYTYANPFTELNQNPSTSDFNEGTPGTPVQPGVVSASARPTERKYGTAFEATIAGFVGVEYFFAPHISMGAEFNLAFKLRSSAQNEVTIETWDASTNSVVTISTRDFTNEGSTPNYGYGSKPNSKVGLYTQPTGSIFFMFHF
jgi:hypothetical protein